MEKILTQFFRLIVVVLSCIFLLFIDVPKSVVQVLGVIAVLCIMFDME